MILVIKVVKAPRLILQLDGRSPLQAASLWINRLPPHGERMVGRLGRFRARGWDASAVTALATPAPGRPWLRGRGGMIDWIKTAHGVTAIVAAMFATMVAWRNLGLPRLVG